MTKPRREQVQHTAEPSGPSENDFSGRIRTLTDTYGGASRVARTCGFSEGVVRSWRDGRSDPSRERCVTLARGLGISLLWLVAGEGAMRTAKHAHSVPRGEVTSITDTEVDTRRLSAAIRILQSTLDATGSSLSADAHADLLGEYYTVLGNPDPMARAEGLLEAQRHLVERIRQGKLA